MEWISVVIGIVDYMFKAHFLVLFDCITTAPHMKFLDSTPEKYLHCKELNPESRPTEVLVNRVISKQLQAAAISVYFRLLK